MPLFSLEQTPILLLVLAAALLPALEAWRRAPARAKRHLSQIADLEARIRELIEANNREVERRRALATELRQCATWFEEYAKGHEAKGDTEKAERNWSRARHAQASLAETSKGYPTQLSEAIRALAECPTCKNDRVVYRTPALGTLRRVTAYDRKLSIRGEPCPTCRGDGGKAAAPAEPPYIAEGLDVRKRPVVRKNPDGSETVTVGFPVCRATDWIGPEGAKTIAAMLSFAEGKSDGR